MFGELELGQRDFPVRRNDHAWYEVSVDSQRNRSRQLLTGRDRGSGLFGWAALLPAGKAGSDKPPGHAVAGAAHFAFLAPCSAQLAAAAPAVCAPTPGFDRTKFHERFNAEVVRFLKTRL